MSTADLAEPIRTAIINNVGITALLGTFLGAPAVFTRRPVPGEDVPFPMIVVSTFISTLNEDGLFDFRPIPNRDVTVFTRNDTPEHYRLADQIAYLVRALFHRRWRSLTVTGWKVVGIECTGPVSTTQEDQTDGRVVTLAIKLAQLRS
jgi:hypothetical protein